METETKAKVKNVLNGLQEALREVREQKLMEEMRNNEYWKEEVGIRDSALGYALKLQEANAFGELLHNATPYQEVLEAAKAFEAFLVGEVKEAE